MSKNTLSAVDLLRVFRQQSVGQFAATGEVSQNRPVADLLSQAGLTSKSVNSADMRLLYGRIADATPVGYAYRVFLEGATTPHLAVLATHTGVSRTATAEFTTLQPGTDVICCKPSGSKFVIIIGILPPVNLNPAKSSFTLLHTSTRGRVDSADFAPYRMDNNGGVISFGAGRPYDAALGDWGVISQTGCRVLVDMFMAQLGVTEMSQLTFYHHDMLAKLAAYNFIHWSAGVEHEELNDQDELLTWTGYAVYPWEALGYFNRQAAARLVESQEWQKDKPWLSKLETKDEKAMAFHREIMWHGYLGQGGRKLVVVPPSRSATGLQFAGDVPVQYPAAVFDQSTSADGRHALQSVKAIHIRKGPGLRAPVRRRRPEDPQGDTPENYKFSGQLGDGPTVRSLGELPGDVDPAIEDLHAYFCGFAPNRPFLGRKDYAVPGPFDSEWDSGKFAESPNFTELKSQLKISVKQYRRRLFVDANYGEVDASTLSSGLDFLDDGGVVLYDGCGSEIRMEKGSITIACAGDVWLKPGRNLVQWAGDDVNIRANSSVDIVASNKDVRIKAENNLMALGGNSGYGGVLVESRGYGSQYDFSQPGEKSTMSGLVLRSTKSDIAAWASNIYMRTGSEDGSILGGNITLDAGKGKYSVAVVAANMRCHVKNFVDINYGEPGSPKATAYFSQNLNTLSGPLMLDGSLAASGGVYATGSLFSSSGHVYTGNAKSFDYLVGSLEGKSKADTDEYLAKVSEYVKTTLRQQGVDHFASAFTENIYASNGVGNISVIAAAGFSFRSSEDYGVTDFRIDEDLWQRMARTSGQAVDFWNERPVIVQQNETYPYPGTGGFTRDSFVEKDLLLFSWASGSVKSPTASGQVAEAYANPEATREAVKSLRNYRVIKPQ